MRFENWTIRTKLLSGFAFVLLIACIVSLLGIANLARVDDANTLVAEKTIPSIKAAAAIRTRLANLRIARLGLILADATDVDAATAAFIAAVGQPRHAARETDPPLV